MNYLHDVTFIIPIRVDSEERLENLYCVISHLKMNFHCHIMVIEDIGDKGSRVCCPSDSTWVKYSILFRDDEIFHRTRVINWGIKNVRTKFFAIYDTDCIFDVAALYESVNRLRAGADMVYPYSGRFVNIDRSYIVDGVIKEQVSCATGSVGGAVFLRTVAYKAAGLDNEYLISHCPDDVERYERMLKLGYKVERVDGTCWHITHPVLLNSRPVNDFTKANLEEYNKVKAMSKIELEEYIKTWPWAKNN